MTAQLQCMPGTFPLAEDKPFITESEWVILKLLCRPLENLGDANVDEGAEELAEASGGQLSVARSRELISIVRISRLHGLGSWMARLLVEAGCSEDDVLNQPAGTLCERVNGHMGYTICNTATCRALESLQAAWNGSKNTPTQEAS